MGKHGKQSENLIFKKITYFQPQFLLISKKIQIYVFCVFRKINKVHESNLDSNLKFLLRLEYFNRHSHLTNSLNYSVVRSDRAKFLIQMFKMIACFRLMGRKLQRLINLWITSSNPEDKKN